MEEIQPFMPGQSITYFDEDDQEPVKGFIEMLFGNGNLLLKLENGKYIEVSITKFNH